MIYDPWGTILLCGSKEDSKRITSDIYKSYMYLNNMCFFPYHVLRYSTVYTHE